MSTLTVVKFDDPAGADQAMAKLEELQKQNLIRVLDAAIVTWAKGEKKPKTRQMYSTTGAGALNGSFWGFLFGLIFFVPLLGAAIGAAMGALSGSLVDVGINDDFINKTREQVTEGTSAIFLLTQDAVVERIAEDFKDLPKFELIASNLTSEQEAKLIEAFSA